MAQPERPKLDAVDMTATANGHSERLSETEYLLLEQLLRYAEQAVARASLASIISDQLAVENDTVGDSGHSHLPDRVIDRHMLRVMQKTNALYAQFPLVRRLSRDSWIYTEVAPRRKART